MASGPDLTGHCVEIVAGKTMECLSDEGQGALLLVRAEGTVASDKEGQLC